MVRIRLRREGKKGQPSYRIVAADKEAPRDGRFLEILGHYNPRTQPATIMVKEDRLYDWIGRGAQPSESVWQILRQVGADERIKRFKAGEDVETLLAEAEAAVRDVDPRTRRDEEPAPSARKAAAPAAEVKAKETAPEAVAPAAEPTAEVEAEVEAEAAAEAVEAEVETEEVEAETEAEAEAASEAEEDAAADEGAEAEETEESEEA